jgi:hypothetical protein
MTNTTTDVRSPRLEAIMEGYDLSPFDVSGPGSALLHDGHGGDPAGRFALVTEVSGDGRRLTLRESVAEIEAAATQDVLDGREPVCYFDLDELAGDPPMVETGDEIRYRGEVLHVVAVEYDPTNGRRQLVLDLDPDADADDPTVIRLDEDGDRDRYEVVVRISEDDRMPVRYAVAKIAVTVAFNTTPSPA